MVSPLRVYAFMMSIILLVGTAGLTSCEKPASQAEAPDITQKADVSKDAGEEKDKGKVKVEVAPPPSKSSQEASSQPTRIVVYYFHGTTRCQACLDIERMARETVYESFFGDMMEGLLEWRAVNYDIPSNAALCADFNLPYPSLVLVSEASGSTTDWKLLERTWDLVSTPDEFRAYVKSEIESLLMTLPPRND